MNKAMVLYRYGCLEIWTYCMFGVCRIAIAVCRSQTPRNTKALLTWSSQSSFSLLSTSNGPAAARASFKLILPILFSSVILWTMSYIEPNSPGSLRRLTNRTTNRHSVTALFSMAAEQDVEVGDDLARGAYFAYFVLLFETNQSSTKLFVL